MTVLDTFLDRPRVVPKQVAAVSGGGKRKSSTVRSQRPMPEIRGCTVGGIRPATPTGLFSMAGTGAASEPDGDGRPEKQNAGSDASTPPAKKQKILVKTSRTPVRNRRKSRWKLKFHHQALPPEYLRHYKQQERKRRQTETGKNTQGCGQGKKLAKKLSGTSEPTKRNDGDGSEVTGVKSDDVRGREDTPDNADGLSLSDASTSPATPLSRPPSTLSACLTADAGKRPFKSAADDLLQSSLCALPHLNIDVSQNKAFLENLLTNQIEINRVVQKERRRMPAVSKPSLTQLNRLKSGKTPDERVKSYPIPPSGKIMNYSDLPYMGEITLDGIKPRRGRKPKKADICHLIYKNYGQVFPGAPEKEPDEDGSRKQVKWRPEPSKSTNSSQRTKGTGELTAAPERLDSPLPTVSGLLNHTEVQNRIINSLLEKRLTQEMKMKAGQFGETDSGRQQQQQQQGSEGEEPLNLCLRDLQSLKIKLSRKHGNVYEATQRETETRANVEPEMEDAGAAEVVSIDRSESDVDSTEDNDEEDDLAPFNLVTTELRESSDDEDAYLNLGDQITLTRVRTPPRKADGKFPEEQTSGRGSPLLFWPGGNVLPGMPPSPVVCYSKLPDLMAPGFNLIRDRGASVTGPERKLPRSKSDGGKTKRTSTSGATSKSSHALAKRKRSAIFIPPVPAESTTNPTTEVSICKFKFTGGAKPSLQEKKMLSVDSGGNFRYYSGTGDKSMRGYEYFPRESLQQCQENTGCSPSGVFLTASALGSGEKIPEEIGHSGFFDSDFRPVPAPSQKSRGKSRTIKRPEDPSDPRRPPDPAAYRTLREHLLDSKPESGPEVSFVPEDDGNSSDQSGDFDLRGLPQTYLDGLKLPDDGVRGSGRAGEPSGRNRKLRKTRKSIAREKLEQTFKEKGFLIQTQQLESAEGATYCKFRQLRKFTRYLFRSWKDYLPGNVRNLSVDAGVDNPEMLVVPQAPEAAMKRELSDTETGERFN